MKFWNNIATTLAVLIAVVPSIRECNRQAKESADSHPHQAQQGASKDKILIEKSASARDVGPCFGGGGGHMGVHGNEK